MNKSLNIDIIVPWEVGLIIVVISLTLIFLGNKQSKKIQDDFDKTPLINPITKIFFGTVGLIFGLIQLLPLIK